MAGSRFTDPTFGRAEPKTAWAPRPARLHGKVIGLLDNTKEQTQIILTTIGDALIERYGAARVVYRTKETFSKPAAPQIIDEMATEVHVAVAALGG
jgi:hypothetical protein